MDKLKILVVDDEERMRKLVKDFLIKKDFEVIELHQRNSWDTRVLLRGKAKDRYNRNTCISLSLVTFSIITAYKNSATDNHYTLQSENYEDTNVEYLLEELAK